jgi:hypothetical protein
MIEAEKPSTAPKEVVDINDLAINFIIGGMHEISIVEEDYFKEMVCFNYIN